MTVILAHAPDDAADAALDAALEQARWRGTALVVVNVASGEALIDPRIASEGAVHAVVERGRTAGVETSVEQPVDDDVAAAVLSAAQAHGATVVVVGCRRRSPVGKLLLGSVSQRIVLEADCPVLCVKAPR